MALVYIADDEPELVSLLAETLQEAGHEVVTSANGHGLLEKVATKAPDVILLDINMPGLSGWEVRKELLQRGVASPVIAVTAQGGAATEMSALGTLHFAGFVRKPFKLVEVLGAVEDVLGE